jgi:hypothetical protein
LAASGNTAVLAGGWINELDFSTGSGSLGKLVEFTNAAGNPDIFVARFTAPP